MNARGRHAIAAPDRRLWFPKKWTQQKELRWLSLVCLAISLVVFGSCRRAVPTWKNEVMALIPAQAGFVGGLALSQVYTSQAYALHRAQLESGPTARMLAHVQACGLRPQDIDFAGIGLDTAANYALILQGKGVGEVSRWSCLAQRSQGANGLEGLGPAFRVDDSQSPVLLHSLTAGGAAGVVVDDTTVVLCSANWLDAVRTSVASIEPLAPQLAALVAEIDRQQSAWFAGTFPPGSASAADLLRLGGAVTVTDAVAVRAFGRFRTPAAAESALAELGAKVTAFATLAPVFGVPPTVVAAIAVEQQGDLVTLNVPVSRSDLMEMQRTLSLISRGPQEAPPLPPPTLGLNSDAAPPDSTTVDSAAPPSP